MKKNPPKLFLFLVLISVLGSCKQEQQQPKPKLAQTVFYEIFPALLDSIFYDKRVIPLAPPPPPEYYKDKPYKNFDDWMKSDEYKGIIKDWEKMRDSIVQDTTSIYLVVYDSVTNSEKDDKQKFIQYLKKENISTDSIIYSMGFRIDLSKLTTTNKKIKFKYLSEFPKGRKFWRTEYDFYIAATIGFTRLYFNQTKTHGVMNIGYTMGVLNGYGVRVFIKKNKDGKWVIDDTAGTWIS